MMTCTAKELCAATGGTLVQDGEGFSCGDRLRISAGTCKKRLRRPAEWSRPALLPIGSIAENFPSASFAGIPPDWMSNALDFAKKRSEDVRVRAPRGKHRAEEKMERKAQHAGL